MQKLVFTVQKAGNVNEHQMAVNEDSDSHLSVNP
jgi:hypothetical protein